MILKIKNIFFALCFITLNIRVVNLYAQFNQIWNQINNPSISADIPWAITLNASGIYVAGVDYSPGNFQWHIEKRNLNTGALDASFGGGTGVITNNPSSGINNAYAITADASGIYVAGSDESPGNGQWRIEKRDLTTGLLIPSFGTAGVVTNNPSSGTDIIYAITADATGIYLAGVDASPGTWQWRIEKRDLATGVLIPSFGTGGIVLDNPSLRDDIAQTITVDASGIYVVGFDQSPGLNDYQWRIDKLDLTTGAYDVSFGVGGVITNNPSPGVDYVFSITADASGIYIAGVDNSFGGGNYQWRIEKRDLITGAYDAAFGGGTGVVTNNPSGGTDFIHGITADASGIYVAGYDNNPGNYQWHMEKRNLSTGEIICSQTSNPGTRADRAHAITVDASGIYVTGPDESLGTNNYRWRIEKYDLCTVAVLNATVTATNPLCGGQCTGTAEAVAEGGSLPYTYEWSPSGGNSYSATGLCEGTYTVTITDDLNNIVTKTITIAAPAALTATASGTNPVCNGGMGSATVSITGNTFPPYQYFWENGQTTEAATGLIAGTYTVIITDDNGCNITTSVIIVQPEAISVNIISNPTACIGQTGIATATIVAGGNEPYHYRWDTNPVQTTQNITGLGIGIYTVTITDSDGCTQTQTVTIITTTVQPIVIVSASITKIISGDSTQLNASGGVYYQWIPAIGLSCTTCPNPTARPTASIIYCVEVMDANGCTNNDCVTIDVEELCGELFVPSAFSPDNNGQNDFECVFGNCIRDMTFTVFNRWGEKVFETTDPEMCWDGQYKGKSMNPNVFAYYLKATLLNEEQITKKGNISLIK